jgi:hypothetical protein
MPFALLQMVESQRGKLVTTKSAGKQQGEQGPIPFALQPNDTVLLKDNRGSEQYQSTNSSMACR